MCSRELKIDQDIDGSSFFISYKGIVGSKISIKGRIHILNGKADFQEIKVELK